MNKYISSVLIFASLIQLSWASDLPEAVSDSATLYQTNVNVLCQSSFLFDLNMPLQTASRYFDRSMECFFDSASNGFGENMEDQFTLAYQSINMPSDFLEFNRGVPSCDYQFVGPDADWDIEVLPFNEVVQQQKNLGGENYQDHCQEDVGAGSVNNPYSSCRVAQAALRQLCSYELYLQYKPKHDSNISERAAENNGTTVQSYQDFFQNAEFREDNLQDERLKAEAAVETALEGYSTFETTYRPRLWVHLVKMVMIKTQARMRVVHEAIHRWPVKFNNSATMQND